MSGTLHAEEEKLRDLRSQVDRLLAEERVEEAFFAVWRAYPRFAKQARALTAGWQVLAAQTRAALGSPIGARTLLSRVDESVLLPEDLRRLDQVRAALTVSSAVTPVGRLGRFRPDPVSIENWLSERVLVVCPNCNAAGIALFKSRAPAPFTCTQCGCVKTWRGLNTTQDPAATDKLDLLLTIRTRHGWLWAANEEHLAQLRAYVSAGIRQRTPVLSGNASWTSRLPAWITAAKNRDDILRALTKLDAKLNATQPR